MAGEQWESQENKQKLTKETKSGNDVQLSFFVAFVAFCSNLPLFKPAARMTPMSNESVERLPRVTQREMQFAGGTAIGMSQRWIGGQCCAIQTAVGIVGCGIYALDVPAEFGQAIAIARGTPANPL